MDITWLGDYGFRLRGRSASAIIDPPTPDSGYTLPRSVSSEIVLLTHDYPGQNDVAASIQSVRKVVSGPGEYEIAGILIQSVRTYQDAEMGTVHGNNTAYLIEIDGVTICHLGAIGHVPTAAQAEELSRCEVLLIPVGGEPTLTSARAMETISRLEPRIVVPMRYRTVSSTASIEPVDSLLREMGVTETEPQPRLNVTPTNLPLETRVVLLDTRS